MPRVYQHRILQPAFAGGLFFRRNGLSAAARRQRGENICHGTGAGIFSYYLGLSGWR
jgi:hypothetical protein